MVKAFETAFGVARKQKVPCDSSIQLPDEPEKLSSKDASSCRSIVGLCLFVSREPPDLMFTIKELASNMSSPSLVSAHGLRKLVGYMKHVGDVALRLNVPAPGQGRCFSDGAFNWILETYSDADWSSNKDHRKSTSCGMHYLNTAFVYGSSRSQKTISLSSCESELHSIVSAMCDGIFIVACAQFVLGEEIKHVHYTDSSSARQLASREGCGRLRHVSGKILWVQQKTNDKSVLLKQVPTIWNVADIGTKCLQQKRLFFLMHESGLVDLDTFESVVEQEHQEQVERSGNRNQLQKIAKVIMRLSLVQHQWWHEDTYTCNVCNGDQ